MFGRGAVKLFLGVEDLEGKDREAVDDEAGGFGVERGRGVFGRELDEGDVDLLGEVVAKLVDAIDVVLYLDDGGVRGFGVAGLIFAVPEVEVGAVLIEDEVVEGCGGLRGWECGVVTVGGGLVVERDDVGGVEHEWRECRITEARLGR